MSFSKFSGPEPTRCVAVYTNGSWTLLDRISTTNLRLTWTLLKLSPSPSLHYVEKSVIVRPRVTMSIEIPTRIDSACFPLIMNYLSNVSDVYLERVQAPVSDAMISKFYRAFILRWDDLATPTVYPRPDKLDPNMCIYIEETFAIPIRGLSTEHLNFFVSLNSLKSLDPIPDDIRFLPYINHDIHNNHALFLRSKSPPLLAPRPRTYEEAARTAAALGVDNPEFYTFAFGNDGAHIPRNSTAFQHLQCLVIGQTQSGNEFPPGAKPYGFTVLSWNPSTSTRLGIMPSEGIGRRKTTLGSFLWASTSAAPEKPYKVASIDANPFMERPYGTSGTERTVVPMGNVGDILKSLGLDSDANSVMATLPSGGEIRIMNGVNLGDARDMKDLRVETTNRKA